MKTCSVIFNDRNDDHKEHERVKYSLVSAIDMYDEILFVDWNSPIDRGPLLHKMMDHIPKTGKIKHIIVSKELADHMTSEVGIPSEHNVGIPDPIARNIAIRRATSDYIANISGIDIFGPTKDLFNIMLASLQDDTFYTLSRRELDRHLLYENYTPDKWEEALKFYSDNSDERRFYAGCTANDWFSMINCCGDFQIAHRDIWHTGRGIEEKMYLRCFSDTNTQKKAVLNRYKLEAIFSPPVFHISHDEHESESARNSPIYWVDNFRKTENTENWGFKDIDFDIEVI